MAGALAAAYFYIVFLEENVNFFYEAQNPLFNRRMPCGHLA
ncbi:hypothetical protein ACOJUR_12775 [Alicyclobacillus tolerans]